MFVVRGDHVVVSYEIVVVSVFICFQRELLNEDVLRNHGGRTYIVLNTKLNVLLQLEHSEVDL